MDTLQDSIQIQQHISPLIAEPLGSSFSAPVMEETPQTEDREPLRVACSNDKENKENPEQEQNEAEEEEDGENKDNITDYVAQVLEKLVKQRNKMAKLTSVLEKKGLLTERKVSQDQAIVQEVDTESNAKEEAAVEAVEDDSCSNSNSKENLSPTRSKPEAKTDNTVAVCTGPKTVALAEKKPAAAVNFSIKDVLEISRKEITYGHCFPGQIAEEQLDIVNKSGHDFVVQIVVNCLNDDLQDTEEYVYSIRRSHLYDYNDKHYLIMAPYSVAGFKLAMKVPSMRMNGRIIGNVCISVQGAMGSFIIDLNANVSVPKVFCPKELCFKGLDYKVVKLAIKEGKKQEFKIPIRNQGEAPVTLELEFHEPESNREQKPLFDCLVHPNVVTVAPNSNALTSLLLKPVKSVRKDGEKPKSERKILVGRVKDSALIYSFVFWVEVY